MSKHSDEAERLLDQLDEQTRDALIHKIRGQLLEDMAPMLTKQIDEIREQEAEKVRAAFNKDRDSLIEEAERREGQIAQDHEKELQILQHKLSDKDKKLAATQEELAKQAESQQIQIQKPPKPSTVAEETKRVSEAYIQSLEETVAAQTRALAQMRTQSESTVNELTQTITQQNLKIQTLSTAQQTLKQENIILQRDNAILQRTISDQQDERSVKSALLDKPATQQTISPIKFYEYGPMAEYLKSADAKTLAKSIDRNMKVPGVALDKNINQYHDLLNVMPASMIEKMHAVGQELQKRLDARMKFSGRLVQDTGDFGAKVANAFSKLFGKKLDDKKLEAACNEYHEKASKIEEISPTAKKFVDQLLASRTTSKSVTRNMQ